MKPSLQRLLTFACSAALAALLARSAIAQPPSPAATAPVVAPPAAAPTLAFIDKKGIVRR